jgi:hypothetical protein
MTFQTMMVAAASTAVAAAASAAVWYATGSQNPAPAAAPSGASAPAPSATAPGSQDVVVVCVAGDQIVHAPQPQGGCPSGQRLVSLLSDDEECPLCPSDDKSEDLSEDPALRDIERRIHALEHAPYFEVVNKDEQPVFVVSRDGVRVFDKGGVPRAAFDSSGPGGSFTVSSGLADASLTTTGMSGGVRFVEGGLTRLALEGNDSGGSSLRIPSGNGVIAGFGVSKEGSGTLLIGMLDGRVKSTLSVSGERGMVQVRGDNDAAISLMEQGIGGGMLQIDSRAGAIVKMGHVGNTYGIVMTGPRPGLPLVPKSGLPGSYFMGCGTAAPPACAPVTP